MISPNKPTLTPDMEEIGQRELSNGFALSLVSVVGLLHLVYGIIAPFTLAVSVAGMWKTGMAVTDEKRTKWIVCFCISVALFMMNLFFTYLYVLSAVFSLGFSL